MNRDRCIIDSQKQVYDGDTIKDTIKDVRSRMIIAGNDTTYDGGKKPVWNF